MSSIEVVNLLLGTGNDYLDIQGTLQPAPAVIARGTFELVTGAITKDGVDWKALGFLVGQSVAIDGARTSAEWSASVARTTSCSSSPLRRARCPTAPSPSPASDPQTIVTSEVDVAPTGYGVDVSGVGVNWIAEGFVVGALVYLTGYEPQTWRVVGISTDGLTMQLRGAILPVGEVDGAYVAGAHGGLTVVHGGGNRQLSVNGAMTTVDLSTGQTGVIRLDGLAWVDDGVAIGDLVQVGDEPFTREVVGFADWECPTPPPGETANSACGIGAILLLDGLTTTLDGDVTEVHVAEPLQVAFRGQVDRTVDITADSLVGQPGAFDDFEVGQTVTISGLGGSWTIAALTDTTMTLAGAAFTRGEPACSSPSRGRSTSRPTRWSAPPVPSTTSSSARSSASPALPARGPSLGSPTPR